ncbi:MAG TPA: DUF4013 domain-containing protein [Thermoanaerobaculia bacterium]|nr:DUF4013 domain-containing protein [Thermoanaerobaculia bacterium]
MSDYPYTPPPPPPYQPPGPPSSTTTIDFARCFTFAFEDPEWLKKIVVGGLFYLASFILIGIPFLLGYLARMCRNVIAGNARPLPDWDDLGGYFAEGMKLLVVALVYTLPILILYGVMIGGMIGLSTVGHANDGVSAMAGLLGSGLGCLIFFLAIAIGVLLPAALIRVIASGNMADGFNFAANFAFIKTNLSNYLLSIVVQLLANFIAQFGVILFCVGIIFTAFWGMCIGGYAFAETHRLSPVK